MSKTKTSKIDVLGQWSNKATDNIDEQNPIDGILRNCSILSPKKIKSFKSSQTLQKLTPCL